MARFFESSLEELGRRNPGVEGHFRRVDGNRFVATIYESGVAKTRCTVFIGSEFGNGICYVNGETTSSNSMNESLRVEADDQAMFLRGLGMAFGGSAGEQKLSQEGARRALLGTADPAAPAGVVEAQMLSVGEFASGSLSDAQPLALMLPRSQYEVPILVGGDKSKRRAVFLGDAHRFESFQFDRSDNWTGLIVRDVAIEVDEETAFDPDVQGARLGSIVRQDTRLCICASEQRSFGRGNTTFPLMEGLEPMPERHRVGFLRWQIVIGQGVEKRVLRIVDVRQELPS